MYFLLMQKFVYAARKKPDVNTIIKLESLRLFGKVFAFAFALCRNVL